MVSSKTQASAFSMSFAIQRQDVLRLCPPCRLSLLQVWLYHGSSDERSHVLHQAAQGTLEVVITSYGLLRLHQKALFRVPWHAAGRRALILSLCVLCAGACCCGCRDRCVMYVMGVMAR